MKKTLNVYPASDMHWVGDGFPVRSAFGPLAFANKISPFLMMDYGGPAEFPPTSEKRGVGAHPHKGFETVTIVYQGEVEHRDSVGHSGKIGPGDVQWMTAGSGLLHEEYHSRDFARRGGMFEMAQLWVNLPAKDKKAPPRYQSILNASIPDVALPGGAGRARVIAGRLGDVTGPAKTFTPINVWDLRLKSNTTAQLSVPAGYTTALFVLHGDVATEGASNLVDGMLALLEPSGDAITLQARKDSTLLVLNGEPINEPIAAQGPFVMNTREELYEAMMEFQRGQMGEL